jgi:hypothetical protein
MFGVQAELQKLQKTKKSKRPLLLEEKNKSLWVYTALWLQLIGTLVLPMELASRPAQSKYSNGTGQNKMSLLSKWPMLQAQGQEAQLRKRERIILTRLIRSENMTVFGAWPVFLFALRRQ